MRNKGYLLLVLLLVSPIILVQNAISSEGYWILDTMERDNGGRDDVSTIWTDISETALAGKTFWKWDTTDCTQTIVSSFSWSGIPGIMEPLQDYPLTAILEQTTNNNCLSVGSDIRMYVGYPTNISDPKQGLQAYGPSVYFGTGNGFADNNTLIIKGPSYDERGCAILVLCDMYQEWYAVQYRYKWVQGEVPPEYTELDASVEPAPI